MSTSPSSYAYGPSAVPPPSGNGMRTAGKVIFFLGLLLSVIAVAVGVWGLTRTVQVASTLDGDVVAVQGTASVPMEQGDFRAVMADPGADVSCTVTGPDGADVPVTQDPSMENVVGEGQQLVGVFTAAAAGEHEVTCDAPASLSPALGFDDLAGIAAAAIAFLALVPLAMLTLLGLILWLVGRNRAKKAALARQGGAHAVPGYAQPGYEQPSYDQPGYGRPGYDQPGYGQPGYEQPVDTPPPPGSGGWSSPPPPPPGTDSPYAAPPPPEDDEKP